MANAPGGMGCRVPWCRKYLKARGIEVEESACLVACVCCECCEELVYGGDMVDISEELSALGA